MFATAVNLVSLPLLLLILSALLFFRGGKILSWLVRLPRRLSIEFRRGKQEGFRDAGDKDEHPKIE
jgi:hypothetical protein